MLKEFKEFINRGGVFEAAVGLIMALAFAPVVTSVVDDLIMPIVARLVGQPDFSELKIGLGGQECDAEGVCTEAAIRYGAFINTVVSFVLIALVVFLLVKAYNNAQRPAEEEEAGPTEVELLTEIRDQLAR